MKSDEFAYKFFTLLFMQMAWLPSYLMHTVSLSDLTICIMHCFSLDNLSTSDVSVTAVKARTNWHILFCDGQLWFCKFPSSEWTEIFTPATPLPPLFFHKAMWERQVLWGCERIYSFSQKKIGHHPPTRLTVSRVYALHRRRLMPLNLMEGLGDLGEQEERIFSIHFPNPDM